MCSPARRSAETPGTVAQLTHWWDHHPCALMVGLVLTGCSIQAEEIAAPLIPTFSRQPLDAQAPRGWSTVTFRKSPRHTQYSLVSDDGTVVVRAHAQASASALSHRLHADSQRFPILRWRWKIEHVLAHSDMARKRGDDYPARVYVTFDIDSKRASMSERMRYRAAQLMFGQDLPYAGLCYVWDTHAAIGTIAPNAYTANVRMIVVESGPERTGRWIQEQRNILDDYRAAFGSDPPPLSGIAIMTDTDDTGESVTAWYGDVSLEPPAAAR
jgi:hypothetical protein